jgi:aldose 1-epimerase
MAGGPLASGDVTSPTRGASAFTSTTPAPLSGHQIHLALGDQEATVTDVGAKLRRYAVGGRDVVVPFDEDVPAPAGHGAVLAPWPNRLRDGRYTWEGEEYQVPISEPERGTALHGLAMFQRWQPVVVDDAAHREGAAATLELRLAPGGGYPFDVLLSITYRLTATGLHVQAAATNLGTRAAPYGIGFHPWLSPGEGSLDDCTIRIDAATRVTVDDRLLPTGTEPVAGMYDLREPRPAHEVDVDDAFVDVLRDEDGLSWIRLTGSDGRTAAVWMDESMDTWQACTGDHLGVVEWRRTGLAAEPMSCIADAFRTGDRLVRLEPGASHEVTWGATLL